MAQIGVVTAVLRRSRRLAVAAALCASFGVTSPPATSAQDATATSSSPTDRRVSPAPVAGAESERPAAIRTLPRLVRTSAAVSAPQTPTGVIRIPAIGLVHPTFEGIEPEHVDLGPTHWPGTAQPGENGNAVFAGHRTTWTRPFFDLDRLRAGDELVFERPNGVFVYVVSDSFVVKPEDTWIINPTDEPTVTLFTCHPKYSERQRYVVVGTMQPQADPTSGSTTSTTAPERCTLCVPSATPWP